jgi:hypothetical protein
MRRSSATPRPARRRLRPVPAVTVLLLLAALALPTSAAATSRHPLIVPPVGKLYDHLSVAWWQYVLEQPKATNPLLDQMGAGCRTGQRGAVFFLVGTAGDGTATRDQCTAPAGRLLFFPVVNAFDVHVVPDGLDTPELVWEDFTDALGFRVDSMHASVDGVAVRNLDPASSPYRGCAGPASLAPGCARPFALTFPTGNLFDLPAGTYSPAVADGFYLLLAPLRPGVHTITFGGSGNLGGSFTTDTTYHLRVTLR